MIVFNLTCSNDHRFEGWFASAADCERQQQSTMLSCPVCGSNRVSKSLHAPHVNTGNLHEPDLRGRHARNEAEQYANIGQQVSQLVEHLLAITEDVGDAFPEEARRIHYNEMPERKIRGNASREEVMQMRDEGIEVIALPIPRYRLGKSH